MFIVLSFNHFVCALIFYLFNIAVGPLKLYIRHLLAAKYVSLRGVMVIIVVTYACNQSSIVTFGVFFLSFYFYLLNRTAF